MRHARNNADTQLRQKPSFSILWSAAISVSLGGDVREVRIVQGPLAGQPAPVVSRKARPLTAAERAALEASVATIEDIALRQAVFALGEAVYGSQQAPPLQDGA